MLTRRLSLLQTTAINMIDMVGIGPFITLPIVIRMMNGPYFLYAWIAGALLSFVDATVWSQLGAAFPLAGGSYNFLKIAYGESRMGRMMSFLFVWQTMIQAPLVIASAAIGFSGYANYLFGFDTFGQKAVSGLLVLLIVLLLYRRIEQIGKISVLLWMGVLITLIWVISAGIAHGNFLEPVKHMNDGLTVNAGFAAALGFASVKSVYSYLGYYNACHLGAEVINPTRNIPRSMFLSITCIALLYLAMNVSVTSVIPWNEAMQHDNVVSVFIERLMGETAAIIVTILILWVAFASLFSATLGYSRIPYAAAADGNFFKLFARTHPTKDFPHYSLIFIGVLGFIFSLLFKLSEVISAILAMRIIIQFIGQSVGLIILSRRKKDFPWKMWLFPVPALIAIVCWIAILASTGWQMVLSGLIVLSAGTIVYFIKANYRKEWPFNRSPGNNPPDLQESHRRR